MSSSASEKLAKNTVIYLIGNAGGKVLQMLLLPLVTAVLLTEEYGYYDLVFTSVSLVTPIVTLQLTEAMFRNLFEGTEEERRKTLSTVFVFMMCSLTVLLVSVVVAKLLFDSIAFPVLIYLVYVGSIAFTCLQKIARTQQKNLDVAVSGVIYVIVMVAVQAFTLLVLDLRIEGMLIGLFCAFAFAALYLEIKVCARKSIRLSEFDGAHLKELIALSLPLVPNSVCWWFISACDKYIISAMISVAANGVFAIANSFAHLITFVTSVFQMAWQESSIMESSSENRNEFYSKTFNSYMNLLLCGAVVALPFIRLMLPLLVAESYQEAYLYVPLLVMSAVFSAFSQFYGSSYLAFKKTKHALSSTLIAAATNIGLTVSLVLTLGLFAPAIGTSVAFLVQWLFRIWQTRSYFRVKLNLKVMVLELAAVGVVSCVYYLGGFELQVIALLGSLVLMVVLNKEIIKRILSRIRK